jgi:L-asparaginase
MTSSIKVLYTGGTIGMQASANGLAPASGFEARLRGQLLAQPALAVPEFSFRELLPLIDSANMTPAYWQRLRTAIVQAVDDERCNGVLVLHGTDTLAYSAAAMAFQLLGLAVPVVFTGSMLPAGAPDSDAWENTNGALMALGSGLPTGVHLYFHGQLLAQLRPSSVRCPQAPGWRGQRGRPVCAAELPSTAERRPGRRRAVGAGLRRPAVACAGRQRRARDSAGMLWQRYRALR